MPLIRDTIDPTNEREVSATEALSLERMGLLFDESKTRAKTDDGLRAAAARQVADRHAPPPPEPDEPAPAEPDDIPDGHDVDDDTETPGADPASTTDDSPTTTDRSPQED